MKLVSNPLGNSVASSGSHTAVYLFFIFERLSASMARSLRLELYLYTAVDSRPGPGGSRLRYTDKAQVAATGPYWPKGARNKKKHKVQKNSPNLRSLGVLDGDSDSQSEALVQNLNCKYVQRVGGINLRFVYACQIWKTHKMIHIP